MSERKDNCPNCHCRNLGKSNAQVLEEFAEDLEATSRAVYREAQDRHREGWDDEANRLGDEAYPYYVAALRARKKAKEEN